MVMPSPREPSLRRKRRSKSRPLLQLICRIGQIPKATNYNQLHDTSAALAFFRAGQQLDPYHPFPYVGTATVYLRAGDHATALSILRHIAQPAGATGHYHDLLRVRSAGADTPLPTAPPPPYVAPTLLSHLSPPAPAAVAVGAQRSAVVYLTSNSQEDLADLAQSLVFRV